MSKRKRSSKPGDESTNAETGDDSAVKDDMVHVTSDLLAGSPDIFAPKTTGKPEPEPDEPTDDPVAEPAPNAMSEEPATEAPEGPEPVEASRTLTPEPEATTLTPSGPTPPPPPFAHMDPHPAPPRRGRSTAALGVVLIVLGIFALVIVLSGVDLSQYGWPLFVLVPGLTLLVLGFVGMGGLASIPGGIVTMLGLVLAYQNSTGDWPTWAFAWSLIIPFGLGLGIYLQALRDRDVPALKRGRALIFAGLMIFIFGFVFFESILGISGRDYGGLGKAALPLLLILIGLVLLVRSIQRSRRAA